jgi:hypothetical protein
LVRDGCGFAKGALLATNGFINGVVVFQVDWGMFPISSVLNKYQLIWLISVTDIDGIQNPFCIDFFMWAL